MIYVGIDPSLTSPGLAILESDGSLRGTFSLATKTLRGGARLEAIYKWALGLLPDCTSGAETGRAVIEGYAIKANNRPFDLGEAGGVLRLALTIRGIPYEVAPPATVKKFITGNGQATKEQVAAAIKRNWGFSFVQEDEADAYGMAQLARSLLTGQARHPFQLEVVAKINGGRALGSRPPRLSRSSNV